MPGFAILFDGPDSTSGLVGLTPIDHPGEDEADAISQAADVLTRLRMSSFCARLRHREMPEGQPPPSGVRHKLF